MKLNVECVAYLADKGDYIKGFEYAVGDKLLFILKVNVGSELLKDSHKFFSHFNFSF